MSLRDFKTILEEKIKEYDQVFITPHIKTDFDAIGSAIGFSLIVKKFGKKNYIFMTDVGNDIEPGVKLIVNECKNKISFINLDKYESIKIENQDKNLKSLLIVTDVRQKSRVCCPTVLDDFSEIIVFDHHKEGRDSIETNIKYIAENESSTCEIMADLLHQFNIKYGNEVANYLLAGIYLDTAHFNENCTDKVFAIVSKLMKNGANLSQVREYFAEDFISDQKINNLVQQAQFFTYTFATSIDNSGEIHAPEELAKAADRLVSYKGVDASFVVGNITDNKISISARSHNGQIDVSEIMACLNGGGDAYKAAAKIEDENASEVGQKLQKVLRPGFYHEK